MKPHPECLPCVLSQTLTVARQGSDDDWSQKQLLTEVMRGLIEANWRRTPAEIVGEAIATARETLRATDPMEARRQDAHQALATRARAFALTLADAEDPLLLALTAAAAANVVDALVLHPDLDVVAEFERSLAAGFAAGDLEAARELLAGSRQVLYLLDNAGEVYFDALLIGLLKKAGATVRTVVRSPGLLHDATLEEAVDAKLARVVEVEVPAGTPNPPEATPDPDKIPALIELPPGLHGTSIGRNKALKEAVACSDLVIAKGPANFETFAVAHCPVIHVLRVKCLPVARVLGVEVRDLVLKVVPRAKPEPAPTPPAAGD